MQKARNGRIAGQSHWLEAACVGLLLTKTITVLRRHLRPAAIGNLSLPPHSMTVHYTHLILPTRT